MSEENASVKKGDNGTPNQIEDLTLAETESKNVKGGSGRYLLEYRDLKGEATD